MTTVGKVLVSLRASWRGAGSTAVRRPRGAGLEVDRLEGRTVLSHVGGGFGGLAAGGRPFDGGTHDVGKLHGGPGGSRDPGGLGGFRGDSGGFHHGHGGMTQDPQLSQDYQTLHEDIQAISLKSDVRVSDLTRVHTDLHALSKAGLRADPQGLQTFAHDLLTAVANQQDVANDATLQGELTSVFGATSSTQVSQAYRDVATVAQATNVTTADLTKIDADLTAIQNDQAAQHGGTTAPPPGSPLAGVLGLGR